MKLRFRINTPADKAELVQLWTDEAGWDQIDDKIWEHRFGKSVIALAINDGTNKIVGQTVFVPTIIYLNGREIPGYRPFAAFLTKEARSFQTLNPLKHPMFQMYNTATDLFRKQGAGLIHILPDPLWGRFLQLVPNFQLAKFPLWSLKLPLSEPFSLPDGYKFVEILPTDERLDELWQKSAKYFGCSVLRDSETITWKTSHHKYFYYGLERNGELAGFVDLRFKINDRQWLIGDILASDAEAFSTTIAAVCNQASEFKKNNPEQPLDKVAILANQMVLPVVQNLGFFRDNYNFLFVVHRLDSSLTMEEIAPAKWYISAND